MRLRRGRARRADRESLEFAFPFRDGRGQRNPFGTYGEAIGRVLNVAPGEDATCSRHQGCAHLEFRVRGVCSLPHIQSGFDPGPLFATVHSPPPSSRFPPSALLQLRGPCLPCRSSQAGSQDTLESREMELNRTGTPETVSRTGSHFPRSAIFTRILVTIGSFSHMGTACPALVLPSRAEHEPDGRTSEPRGFLRHHRP